MTSKNTDTCYDNAMTAAAAYREAEANVRKIAAHLIETARNNKRNDKANWEVSGSLNHLVEKMTELTEGFQSVLNEPDPWTEILDHSPEGPRYLATTEEV